MSNALVGPMRPNFLVLTPACVLLGIATAFWSGASLNPLYIILIFSRRSYGAYQCQRAQ